jgi:hypothetical protein
MGMQAPRGDKSMQGLDGYEQMMDTFAEQAKAYWRSWGMLGDHMLRNVDSWVTHQRSYIEWLRRNSGVDGNRPELQGGVGAL